jgi:hypothetical protein
MRIHILPFLLGFILLGAFSHEAAQRIRDRGADTATPAPMRQADMPKQLRALADGAEAGDMDMANAHGDGIAPLPAFIPERDGGSCATGVSTYGGQQVCAWAI